MNPRLAPLWSARTPRERWLLAIMYALLAFVLAWLLVVRPLADTLSEARTRHGVAAAALAEARAQTATIRSLEARRPPPLGASLESVVGRAVSDAGFQLSRLQADGRDRIALTIPAARPQALFAWIAEMETKHGLLAERVSATSNSDRSLAAEIVLRRRGA